MIRVRVIGDKALAAGLRRAARRVGDLTDPTRQASRAVERTARRLAAKRTGRMAAATSSTVAGGLGTIGNRVRYAPFQEHGTRVMRAHPFLRPALYATPITEFYERHAEQSVRGL